MSPADDHGTAGRKKLNSGRTSCELPVNPVSGPQGEPMKRLITLFLNRDTGAPRGKMMAGLVEPLPISSREDVHHSCRLPAETP